MRKIVKNEEVGRLVELAADYVRKNNDKRISLILDTSYSGDKILTVSILDARTWETLSSEEFFLEPESVTAAGIFNDVLDKSNKHKEKESHE